MLFRDFTRAAYDYTVRSLNQCSGSFLAQATSACLAYSQLPIVADQLCLGSVGYSGASKASFACSISECAIPISSTLTAMDAGLNAYHLLVSIGFDGVLKQKKPSKNAHIRLESHVQTQQRIPSKNKALWTL